MEPDITDEVIFGFLGFEEGGEGFVCLTFIVEAVAAVCAYIDAKE